MPNPPNPGPPIDTGTGGFPADDGKLHTYDPVASPDNGATPAPTESWSTGEVKVDNTVRDLSDATKKTLGSYLSKMTLGKAGSASTISNLYPIDNAPNTLPTSTSLRDSKGFPVPPETIPVTQPHFKDLGTGRSDASKNLGNLARGLQQKSGKQIDGNFLLPNATDPKGGPAQDYFSGVESASKDKYKPGYDTNSPVKFLDTSLSPAPAREIELRDPKTIVRQYVQNDITDADKATLATYLSDSTKGNAGPSSVSNDYPVDNTQGQVPTTIRITDSKGYPVRPEVISNTQPHFQDLGTGRSNASAALGDLLRGRQEATSKIQVDGNKLLQYSADPNKMYAFPPPRGEVNVTTLVKGPVKDYLDSLEGGSSNKDKYKPGYGKNNPVKFLDTTISPPPKNDLDLRDPNNILPQYPQTDISDSNKATLGDYLTKAVSVNTNTDDKKFNANTNLLGRSQATSKIVNDAIGGDPNNLLLNATSAGASTVQTNAGVNPSVVDGKLPTITSTQPDPNSAYGKYSSSLIKNRFSNDSKFPSKVETLEAKSSFTALNYSRKYPMGKSLGPNDARDFSYGHLAQVGTALTTRAGLEPGSQEDGNPSGDGEAAAAILPGVAQLGISRIDRQTLTAADAIAQIGYDINEGTLIDPAALSWGSLNNPLDQFSGLSSFGMQLLSIALFAALGVVIEGLSLIFTLGDNASSRSSILDAVGRRTYGASTAFSSGGDYTTVGGLLDAIVSGKFNIWRMLGLPNTRHSAYNCLRKGVMAFFGANVTSLSFDWKDAAQALVGASQSPGYYVVMARSVSRSFLTISDAFYNMGKAFATVNVVSGIKQIFELFGVLRDSKFMRATGVFMRLGDDVIEGLSTSPDNKFDGLSMGAGRRHISRLDDKDAVMGSRLPKSMHLRWSTYRASDLLLKPQALATAEVSSVVRDRMGAPKMRTDIPVDPSSGLKSDPHVFVTDNRITTADREAFEEQLESEYLPFYLHDLRTNEILSFHAFLASLSDGYTSTYDSADSIGRVEPVRTYKNTQRKIEFSFYIVATNPDDFDSMWLKINKLTTMVYPQYDEGRRVSYTDYNMTAPFSQIIRSAPMVRVRIGDFIQSNYSKFNLARLFGYGSKNSLFNNKPLPATFLNRDIKAKIDSEVEALKERPGTEVLPRISLSRHYKTSSTEMSATNPHLMLPKGLVLNVVGKLATAASPSGLGSSWNVVDESGKNADGIICQVVKPPKSSTMSNEDYINLETYYGRDATAENKIIGAQFIFRKSELDLTENYLKKATDNAVAQSGGNTIEDYSSAVDTFMNDSIDGGSNDGTTGNAVAKSFRLVGGKGIAGFIDSMNFDWYERLKIGPGLGDERDPRGLRAPMTCKVSINFSPIHDIGPGLDHMGYNRAPVYPVGPASPNSNYLRRGGNKK